MLKIFRVIMLIWRLETECWFCLRTLWSRSSCTFCRNYAKSPGSSSPHGLCCLSSLQPCHAVWCTYREFSYGWCELGHTSLSLHRSSPHSTHCTRVFLMELDCSSRRTGRTVKCIQCLYSWQDSEAFLSDQTSSIRKIWRISSEECTFLPLQSNQQRPSPLYKCSASISPPLNLNLSHC